MESSRSRRREGFQNRRAGYSRNNQVYQNTHYFGYQDPETSASNMGDSRVNYFEQSSADYSDNINDVNFNRHNNNSQQYNRQRRGRGRFQHSSPNQLNCRSNFSKDLNKGSEHDCAPDESSVSHSENPDVTSSSQRGKIVSGRYIRQKQHIGNQGHVSNSRSQDSPSTSDMTDRNYAQFESTNQEQSQRKYAQNKSTSQGNPYRSSYNQREDHVYYSQSSNSRQPSYPSKNYERRGNNSYVNSNNSYKYQNHHSNFQEEEFYEKKYKSPPAITTRSVSHDNKATQRELLIHRLNNGESECLVCCEHIRTKDQTWHCLSCYHVFHLRCIKKWARSPAAAVEDGSWRCPACQSLTSKVPFDYICFCGKNKNPEVNYHLTPHSCGENCNRVRPECSHPCKELCHPGPCPPCAVVVQKTCPCGKTKQTVPCNQTIEGNCEEICDKILNCGLHRCKGQCHESDCDPCEEIVLQKCYCLKSEKEVACTSETASCFVYSCGVTCGKELSCGHHNCESICHPGACNPCQWSTKIINTCPCGKNSIEELIKSGKAQKRVSCLDPIPTCGLLCGKKLHCGPKDNVHICQAFCHERECPKCLLTTSLKCRCGAFTKEFPCAEITESFIYTCEKRCNRRKDCGRHKCLNNCCTNFEHRCELVCNKKLSCGHHQCQEICHMGNCPTCWNVSFDELRCHCGKSVLYPPIHCGTKPPECSELCIRSHSCAHDVKHNCHSDDKCPPCTSLTTKWCYGNHKQCGPVMCFLDGVSCGMPCSKPLPCGRHKCKLTCHASSCIKNDEKCTQPCTTPRPNCGHACGAPCHDGPCPETPCKAQVTLNCPCGHRSETGTCYDSTKSYRLLSSTILATKMQEIKEGQSVNLNDVLGKKSKNNKLQCNEECAVIERNKRLAVALQIQNPDLSCSPGPPTYSEFLKDEAKKSPHFVSDVFDKISSLVHLAKESKQKCRSHSFPPMNRDQRRVVHELAEFFGCETQSYDEEPKKNVVVTAYKNKCWLPFINIMTVVQRDMGIRKGPAPVLSQSKSSCGTTTSLSQKKKIDYFDYNE